MEESGIVIKTSAEKADVLLQRNLNCGGCSHCHSTQDGTGMIAEVDMVPGLAYGDRVLLESTPIRQLTAGFIIFILPLIFFIAGFLFGKKFLINSELIALIFGITFASIPYIVIYFFRKFNEKKGIFDFTIKKIISE